jgi:hypothetical protein
VFSKHIRIGPDSTRDAVVMNLLINGGMDAVSARLPATEADALIARLGRARAALNQPVEPDPDPCANPDLTVVDPAWRTSAGNVAPASDVEGVSLAIRHSGYGWLCFVLPHDEAKALGQWLIENAGRPTDAAAAHQVHDQRQHE